MHGAYREQGAEDALQDLSLEKVAVVPTAVRKGVVALGLKAIPKALGKTKSGIGKAYSTAGSKAEQAITKGTSKAIGPQAAKNVGKAIEGVPEDMMRRTVGDATLGAGLMGGIGAATAEEGKRLEGLTEGASSGALSFGLFGAGSAAGGGLFRNVARKPMLRSMAKKQVPVNYPRSYASDLTGQQMNTGFFKNLKNIGTGKGPMGRGASAADLAGRTGELTTEMVLPMALLPDIGGHGAQATQAKQVQTPNYERYRNQYPRRTPSTNPYAGGATSSPQSPQPKQNQKTSQFNKVSNAFTEQGAVPPTYAGTIAGSIPSGIGAGYAMRALESSGKIPQTRAGKLLSVATPPLASALGGLGGYATARKAFPPKVPEELEQLEQIDFDKLMRYYKKKDT